MPPLPGEERLLTVFSDVHYYFTPPSPRPPLHRFDKGSYLYVYHDAAQKKARLEIANNPGLPEQDAFAGSLETILLRNSDKFPTLFTLTVDARRQALSGSPSGQTEWSLISGHPQDTSGTLHRIHTLDIYFWTLEDARLFLATLQRVLEPAQVDTITSLPSGTTAPVSTVVQQLEQVAISDQGYQSYAGGALPAGPTHVPPPPPGAPPNQSSLTRASTGRVSPLEEPGKPQDQNPAAYAPLAYNPAAPAAPEPIKHREKTPPPPDANVGTGLAAAAARDHASLTQSPPSAPTTQMQGYNPRIEGAAMYTPPPPSAGLSQPPPVSPPPAQSTGMSFGPTAGPVSTGPPTGPHPPTPGYVSQAPASDANMGVYRQQSFGPPPTSAHTPHFPQQQQQPSPNAYGQHQQYQPQAQMQAPMGGYPGYPYAQPQQSPAFPPSDMHNQMYRPAEEEQHHNQRKNSGSVASGDKKHGKITENAMRVEKGVNRFLKKLEKRL